jgi:hypothetical protein
MRLPRTLLTIFLTINVADPATKKQIEISFMNEKINGPARMASKKRIFGSRNLTLNLVHSALTR